MATISILKTIDQYQEGKQPEGGGKETQGTSWVFDPSSTMMVTTTSSLLGCSLMRIMMFDTGVKVLLLNHLHMIAQAVL